GEIDVTVSRDAGVVHGVILPGYGSRSQAQLLIGGRVRVKENQREPRLLDPRADPADEPVLPDRGEDGPIVQHLLDLVEEVLALPLLHCVPLGKFPLTLPSPLRGRGMRGSLSLCEGGGWGEGAGRTSCAERRRIGMAAREMRLSPLA